MSWIKGEIVEFGGAKPEHREVRKVRTHPGQDFPDMYFFRLDWARRAGYPDSELVAGKTIEFEPKPGSARPEVGRFKPWTGGGVGAGGSSTGQRGEGGQERRSDRGPDALRGAGKEGAPFLNPYHFIPLVAPVESSLRDAKILLTSGTLHDRFLLAGAERQGDLHYSGRVVCRLETEGPVVLGGEQSKPQPDRETEVRPFELPLGGAAPRAAEMRPAIPGSSLRGLISSIVEAASCSAMRVLPEREFTRRVSIDRREALSEIGMIEERNGALAIRPLSRSVDDMTSEAKRERAGGRPRPAKPADRWRCLVDGYTRSSSSIGREPTRGSFLAARKPKSWSASNREFWYADLGGASFHWSRDFCTGLDLGTPPLSEAEWQLLSESEKSRHTRGILLVLGLDGSKARNLPQTKKHEYFLPFEETGEGSELLDLPPEVVAEFCHLANDASELPRGGDSTDLPYLHDGRERPGGTGDERRWKPRPGDLVYFERETKGKVLRIAYSAAWRRRVGGSLHGSISRRHPDLVPLHPGRCQVTLAERLFGFAEANGKRALASRVRFSHALVAGDSPEGGWYHPEVTLEILAAPKPPSAALYFGQDSYLARRELDLDRHSPQGRKVYLHHQRRDIEDRCYESKQSADDAEARRKAKLKMKVRPLKTGTAFFFHVDFHNLSGEELGYLLYALRPTTAFRHKLGLGKPLGLGCVRIDRVALCFIDREAFYRPSGLFAAKYAGCDAGAGAQAGSAGSERMPLAAELAERYRHEVETIVSMAAAGDSWPKIEELAATARGQIPAAVRWALEHVGDPDSAGARVTYPVTLGSVRGGEHFHWFVNNDRLRHNQQHLKAIEPNQPLPKLQPNGGG